MSKRKEKDTLEQKTKKKQTTPTDQSTLTRFFKKDCKYEIFL